MGSCSTFLLLLCGFRDRLALDVERTCELAERLDLVHHIPKQLFQTAVLIFLELKDNRV